MVEFRTAPYTPMDRAYHEIMTETPKESKLEEPIFPISRLGTTVPEHDPSGRFKNMVQNVQANIRRGAGTMQIVLQTGPESAIGGRPKAYGKEIREALKEIALANKVHVTGVEMPTSMNNLSGFDHRQQQFSEELRKTYLDEVKDAIKFSAEAFQGGGVDIVSWEYPRNVNEADWNKGEFERPGEEEQYGLLVDSRTGRTVQFRKKEEQYLPYDPKTFKRLEDKEGKPLMDPKTGKPVLKPFTWDDIKRWARKDKTSPEKKFVELQLDKQISTLRGQEAFHIRQAQFIQQELEQAESQLQSITEPEKKRRMEEQINLLKQRHKDEWESVIGNQQQRKDIEQQKQNLKPIDEYAFGQSTESYADAGIAAMREQQAHRNLKRDLYVGPEIGWPNYFGSHPKEFIKLIKSSRQKMQEKLITHYGYNKAEAREASERHIKGMFDTSHMGMWLQHFKAEKGETEEQRLKRFNKWYKEQVEEMAKEGVVGGIQLVDSASAAHGHLPPGQGIFPIKEAAKIFKENGFNGYIVSEGHEEEKFGEGRILLKTWEDIGGYSGQSYFSAAPTPWRPSGTAYFGRTYSPTYIFGSYAPSNEFKLWSEVPFE